MNDITIGQLAIAALIAIISFIVGYISHDE